LKTGWFVKLFSALGVFIIVAPITSLMLRVTWSNFISDLADFSAIRLSLWTSLTAALFALLFGVPLAWFLSKSQGRAAEIIRPIVLSPLVLPPTVVGIALISLMGRNGLLGRFIYDQTGWSMPFTSVAVVFTGIFVGLPFIILICESNFRQLPKEVEDAAIIDRANSKKLFLEIALPQSRSAIATAAILAWARAIGEFGATLMFAGSLPETTQTWPMLIYQQLDVDVDSAYALSALMLIVAILVVILLRNPLREAFR